MLIKGISNSNPGNSSELVIEDEKIHTKNKTIKKGKDLRTGFSRNNQCNLGMYSSSSPSNKFFLLINFIANLQTSCFFLQYYALNHNKQIIGKNTPFVK